MTISGSLSVGGIESIINQLNEYAKSLEEKNAEFIRLLLEVGIRVAEERVQNGSHHMPDYISFEKEIETDGGCTLGYLVGQGDTLLSNWIDSTGIEHIDEVFPLAMMEFGSAVFALEPQETFGGQGGQGTFSVSGNENKASWYVTKIDEAGNEVRTYATAIEPTRPMYNAMLEMREQLISCAQQAFGGET